MDRRQHSRNPLRIELCATMAALALGLLMIVLATQMEAQAQTLTVLHSFTGGRDGAIPMAGLTMAGSATLYGTASSGGTGRGTVFELKQAGSGWIFSPLYVFQSAPDGNTPLARVVVGPNHTLYGTTKAGGSEDCTGGCGTVFNLQPPPTACPGATCPWLESILLRFDITDGVWPESEVTFDSAGNLYGTAYDGGGYDRTGGGEGCFPCGTVYELSPSSGGWTQKTLYSFTGYQYGADGGYPVGGVTFDSAGNIYGTTSNYGDCLFGIVFQLTPNGSEWTENILQQICGGGAMPTATMITDASGTFYGDTQGEYQGYGTQKGSVFTLTHSSGGWQYHAIYTFLNYGGGPAGQLFMDSAGNLYGTTITGGINPNGVCPADGCGTIFKLSPSGGGWTYTELYDFTGGSDGAAPYSNLVQDASGNFYGTTSGGGANSDGTVFEFTP